ETPAVIPSPRTTANSSRPAAEAGKRPAATVIPRPIPPGRVAARPAEVVASSTRIPPVPTPSGNSVPPPGSRSSGDSMEERLRRMEDAYLRMERSNQRIQAQYDVLLRKYEDLSTKVSNDPARARTVSRTTTGATGAAEEEAQSPVDIL